MSKKSNEKNGLPLTKPIKTTASGTDLSVFATFGPFKDKASSVLSEKELEEFLEKHFHWRGHALWRSERLVPVHNRKTEQLFIDSAKALCSVTAFRKDIQQIRKELLRRPVAIDQIVTKLCTDWKIADGEEWVAWLIKHWDPTVEQYPPLSQPPPVDSFSPWTIEHNYHRDTKTGPGVCRTAIIVLHAGVSRRDARRVAARAQEALDPSRHRGGRPGLSDLERDMLRKEFAKLGIPKPYQRTAMCRKVQAACTQSGNPRFSLSLIGNEYRRWLQERGQPVRRYVMERT